MVIKDLFSHKIHSSKDSWANKLIDLAFIFAEFDEQPYDRNELERRLSKVSPRASSVSRDPSKFRDEISAYPAYLGLYRVELKNDVWHFVLSDTAKRFLVTDEPNVPAFMLLQLLLFQYPNGMGVAYYSNSDNVRIQANTRDRTLEFVKNKVHLSPFRLICKAIEAKSFLTSNPLFETIVSFDEIFTLANDKRIFKDISPSIESLKSVLSDFQKGKTKPPNKYESRFHILKHTDFLIPSRSGIKIRSPLNILDEKELKEKFNLINRIGISFNGFDDSKNSDQLLESITDASWGKYFDGVQTLNSEHVEILTSEKGLLQEVEIIKESKKQIKKSIKKPTTYSFRKRNIEESSYSDHSKKRVDPELTRIRRQKSNLNHKMLLQKLEEYLESLGCDPVENDHIDLFAHIPKDGKFLFEVKSITSENLLSQTRKGISQLYEYRFRYQDQIGYDVNLCLVLPKQPSELNWLEEYICTDRKIGLIWFNERDEIQTSSYGKVLVQPLLIK